MTKMTFDEWVNNYKPLTNENSVPLALETYGEYDKFVREQDPNKIWTLVEGDDGEWIITGYHWVNRLNYFVTEIPWEENGEVEVPIKDEDNIWYSL